MEVCNIKLPNWMQKLHLSVCRKSLFWDWFRLTYSVWRSGYVGLPSSLASGIELLPTGFREAFRAIELLPEIGLSTVWVIWNLPLTVTDNERRELKNQIMGVYPLFILLLPLHTEWLLYITGILSFKKCVYLCTTYILQSEKILRQKNNFCYDPFQSLSPKI